MHGPCPTVLQPRIVPWEEVYAHVLQPQFWHGLRNLLVPRPYLWHSHVGVEISDHQQRGPLGLLDDCRNNLLYCQGVAWGQVVPHDKPPPVAQRQMKSDNVCAIDPECLHGEVLHRLVEHGDAAAVCAQRL